MTKMARKIPVLGLLAATFLTLSACSQAKEQAAGAISTAKVGLSRAKEMRADRHAPSLMSNAESKLKTAEQNFAKGRYGYAKTQALAASDYAAQAVEQAEAKKIKTQTSSKAAGKKAKSKPAKIRKRSAS